MIGTNEFFFNSTLVLDYFPELVSTVFIPPGAIRNMQILSCNSATRKYPS